MAAMLPRKVPSSSGLGCQLKVLWAMGAAAFHEGDGENGLGFASRSPLGNDTRGDEASEASRTDARGTNNPAVDQERQTEARCIGVNHAAH